MKQMVFAAAALAGLTGCGEEAAKDRAAGAEKAQIPQPSGPPAPQNLPDPEAAPAAPERVAGWESVASGGGVALRYVAAGGQVQISLACLGAPPRLAASVPSFTPIGSEDRFALALGEEPVTLVADPARRSSGVEADGPPPANLAALLAGAKDLGGLYGVQRIGPFPPPSPALAELLAKACAGGGGG